MAVGFASYEIARSGLSVNERGLYVTGHNLSNVNTTGYVRQQSVSKDSGYQNTYTKNGLVQVGLGADIQETRQIRNTFLDNIYRNENTSLGYWDARNKAFEDVQNILGDPMGAGLQSCMNQFWDSWQELAKEPDSLTTRALVRQRSQALVYQFNQIGTQMDRLQGDLNSEVKVRVDELNSITSNIAKLNVEIMKQELNSDSANDLRDQRNNLIDQLSKICNADTYENQDGEVDVTLGGYMLVSKGVSKNLYVQSTVENGSFYYPMLEGTNTIVPIKSGTLKGLLEARGEVSGIKGSYDNGNPRDKADITFAVDVSQGSGTGGTEYLAKLKASMKAYIDDLKKSGIDYNIRIATINGATSVHNEVYTSSNIDSLLNDVDTLFNETADSAVDFNTFIGSQEYIQQSNGFRADANKFAIVFTNDSINGNNGSALTDAQSYINRLNALGMRTSVVTDNNYVKQGEDATEVGWNVITAGTGGKTYDINTDADDFGSLMVTIDQDMTKAINSVMSNTPANSNIVSDIKTRLNAMVNSLARQINYLQMSGITLDGQPGSALFEPLDSNYPMQLGNIKLSDTILSDKGLNTIAAGRNYAKGDNTIALEIANLRGKDLLEDSTGEVSFDEYYRSIILDVGNQGSEAQRVSLNQTNLVQSADNARKSISGVSMDEEMSSMMKYKFAYDASSRVLNTIDQMISTIIERMGVAGR